jgi:hypothetical protein
MFHCGWLMSLIDIEKTEIQRKKFPKVFLGTAFGLTIASFGLAIGAFITLNNAETSKAELGNGLVSTPACDGTGIIVTPFQSFVNRDSSKFTFNEITLTDISMNCAGKDFIINVRDGDGNKLPISVKDDGTLIETVRIYFNQYAGANGTVDRNGNLTNMFTLVGGDSTTVAINAIYGLESTGVALPEDANGDVNWNGDNPKTYWKLRSDTNGVSIVFNPSPTSRNDSILGFADARNVYRVTLESTDHSDQ